MDWLHLKNTIRETVLSADINECSAEQSIYKGRDKDLNPFLFARPSTHPALLLRKSILMMICL